MTGTLNGKVAIVTGGASGIGEAVVRRVALEGGKVVIADVGEERGKELASELGPDAIFVKTDVGVGAQVSGAVEACLEQFGRLDVMMNNAGYGGVFGPIDEIDEDGWDESFRVLVKGVFLGCKYAVPPMRAAGGGVIINTASVAGIVGGYGAHAYATTKAAVVHLTKAVSLETARYGIRVNTVSPGFIATPLATSTLSGTPEDVAAKAVEMRQRLIGPQPLQRMGLPEDIANAVVFLASDQAQFITGQNIVVDGGLSAGRAVELQPKFFYGKKKN